MHPPLWAFLARRAPSRAESGPGRASFLLRPPWLSPGGRPWPPAFPGSREAGAPVHVLVCSVCGQSGVQPQGSLFPTPANTGRRPPGPERKPSLPRWWAGTDSLWEGSRAPCSACAVGTVMSQLRAAHGEVGAGPSAPPAVLGATPFLPDGTASRDPLQGPLPHTDGLRGLLRDSQDSRDDSVKLPLVSFHKWGNQGLRGQASCPRIVRRAWVRHQALLA